MLAYVINLDKDTARLTKMAQNCEEASIAWERFPAVDGRLHAALRDHSMNRMMSPGETGCFHSHSALWAKIWGGGEMALILEDDICLQIDALIHMRKAMAEIPVWDVMMLVCSEKAFWPPGDCVFDAGDRVTDSLVRMGRNRSLMPQYARNKNISAIPGACAYLITPVGAAKLMTYPSAPVDVVLATAFVSDVIGFGFSPPLAFIGTDHDGVSNTTL